MATVLVLLPSLLFAGSATDEPQVIYRTGASEVRVSFFGTGQNGRPLDNISKDDFAIVDNGVVIRNFRSLTRSNETSLDVVALVDASASVEPRFRASMQHVLKLAESEPNTPGDTLSILEFSALQPALVCSGDCRSASTEQKLHTVKAQGATPLFDALTYTAEFVARRRNPGVRQLVILFSDGNDTISRSSAREAFDGLLGTGAVLYAINLDSSGSVSRGSILLQQLSEASGGRSLSAQDDTEDVLETILSDLRSAYVVTYALPSREAGFHSLHILPKHNLKLRFYSRRGYSYEENH